MKEWLLAGTLVIMMFGTALVGGFIGVITSLIIWSII